MKTEQFLKNQMRFAVSFIVIGVIALGTLVILGISGNYKQALFCFRRDNRGNVTLGNRNTDFTAEGKNHARNEKKDRD